MIVIRSLHICSAALGLLSGTLAVVAAKGSWLHRRSGLVFVWSMLIMCVTAFVVASARGQVVNIIASLMTAYLVITAFATVRTTAISRAVATGLMLVALVLGVILSVLGAAAVARPTGTILGFPPFPFFMFGTVGLIGASGDIRLLRGRSLQGRSRLARHLWRMCWALWIAVASFFLGPRERVAMLLPDSLVTLPVRIFPVLLVVVVMVYWLWRVRRPLRSFA